MQRYAGYFMLFYFHGIVPIISSEPMMDALSWDSWGFSVCPDIFTSLETCSDVIVADNLDLSASETVMRDEPYAYKKRDDVMDTHRTHPSLTAGHELMQAGRHTQRGLARQRRRQQGAEEPRHTRALRRGLDNNDEGLNPSQAQTLERHSVRIFLLSLFDVTKKR